MRGFLKFAAAAALWVSALAAPTRESSLVARDDAPLVFAHFMIGIVGSRTGPGDFDADMQNAKAVGIDAFALNIGVDPYTVTQLNYAYQSAANNGMKVFISFDFNWYHTDQAAQVGAMIKQFASQPAQLMVDGKVFASSFAGDGVDVAGISAAAGTDVFFCPNFHPNMESFDGLDAAFNWMAWPNNGDNRAPSPSSNLTVGDGDSAYQSALGGKPYLAPVSPWFSTHYGPEVSYSKNWVFPSDTLWYDRWNEILQLKPRFVEIITWNDYGESHYVGPLSSPHNDDGNSKWTYNMPHDGWLQMAKPFIAAYKAGSTDVSSYITQDELVYWFRPTLAGLDCDATDTTMGPANNASGNYYNGRPNGYQDLQDAVFVVTLLKEPQTLQVTVAGSTTSIQAPAGASVHTVPMAVGKVSFSMGSLSGDAGREISGDCICGIYNFNAYVGTLPAGPADELQPAAYSSIMDGLKVSTCGPTAAAATANARRVVAVAEAVPTPA